MNAQLLIAGIEALLRLTLTARMSDWDDKLVSRDSLSVVCSAVTLHFRLLQGGMPIVEAAEAVLRHIDSGVDEIPLALRKRLAEAIRPGSGEALAA